MAYRRHGSIASIFYNVSFSPIVLFVQRMWFSRLHPHRLFSHLFANKTVERRRQTFHSSEPTAPHFLCWLWRESRLNKTATPYCFHIDEPTATILCPNSVIISNRKFDSAETWKAKKDTFVSLSKLSSFGCYWRESMFYLLYDKINLAYLPCSWYCSFSSLLTACWIACLYCLWNFDCPRFGPSLRFLDTRHLLPLQIFTKKSVFFFHGVEYKKT